jgi:hypothetical protein
MDLDSADVAKRISLKAVTLTHVRYARDDLLGLPCRGFPCCWCSLAWRAS